jgi:hypothetical protein
MTKGSPSTTDGSIETRGSEGALKKLLRSRTEPAQEWTEEHGRLRASLEKLGIKRERPFPDWLVVECLIEDVRPR